jgi:hypothetical protein
MLPATSRFTPKIPACVQYGRWLNGKFPTGIRMLREGTRVSWKRTGTGSDDPVNQKNPFYPPDLPEKIGGRQASCREDANTDQNGL